MRRSPYHPIKCTALLGKNFEETEVRHPEAPPGSDPDRDIKENHDPVHNRLQ